MVHYILRKFYIPLRTIKVPRPKELHIADKLLRLGGIPRSINIAKFERKFSIQYSERIL